MSRTNKKLREQERLNFLKNCDREGILLIAEDMLITISEMEQYFKERDDFLFWIKNMNKVTERENRVKRCLELLHKIFVD